VAREYYTWTDAAGVKHLSSTPPPGETAAEKVEPGHGYRMAPGTGGAPLPKAHGEAATRVTVSGNQVLVPVTLGAGRQTTKVTLLLDTGASQTVLYRDVAARLPVREKQEMTFQVADGRVFTGALTVLDSLELGRTAWRRCRWASSTGRTCRCPSKGCWAWIS